MTAPIASAFQCPGTFRSESSYGSGHINDTSLVVFEDRGQETRYIQQRINHLVFKDVPALMENVGRVTRHQHAKLASAERSPCPRQALSLIPTHDGLDFHYDAEGNYWRMYPFIEGSRSIDVVETTAQAFEAAKAFGEFQFQLADLPGRLHETIPNFHHTRSRYTDLTKAIEADSFNRACELKDEIDFAIAREPLVDAITDRLASGELPERVTHNDTKLNNVLFSAASDNWLCLIDLDTVMPGCALYDFGDMVRSTTTQAREDEPDTSKVAMNIDYFQALVDGYLETASGFLSPNEIELLPFSGQLICFEIGLRFLTDYLQGDIYFKTQRVGQNISRCRKQFKMVQSIEEQLGAMQKIVEVRG